MIEMVRFADGTRFQVLSKTGSKGVFAVNETVTPARRLQVFHEFRIEPREPSREHRITRRAFDEWLRRPGGSPSDVA
jgi:hypothetical protein